MPRVHEESINYASAYKFHGLEFDGDEGQVTGNCPWCGREGKFSLNLETGIWRCWICGEGNEKGGGNLLAFLRKLWSLSDKATVDYKGLAAQIGLLYEETLEAWGVCQSITTGDWLVPGYSARGSIDQLYRYAQVGERMALLPTPGMKHGLHGLPLYDKNKPIVYLCEGWKDGMALWEMLKGVKHGDNGTLVSTANPERSLAGEANVLAVPSCTTFSPKWCGLFSGKSVRLMFDSDHPQKNKKSGNLSLPAGYSGMKRVSKILLAHESPPEQISFLQWGPEGYDTDKASGYDVRDHLREGADLTGRMTQLESLLAKVGPIPDDWSGDGLKKGPGGQNLECLHCSQYSVLVNAWRKAMKWTPGLDHALAMMLASIASTKSVGDQLWIKVIGPAACLRGDTLIWDPVDQTLLPVQERFRRRRDFHVCAMTKEGKLTISLAYAPTIRPPDHLYCVAFKSGAEMHVTENHRFWNGDRYWSVASIITEVMRTGRFQMIRYQSGPYLPNQGEAKCAMDEVVSITPSDYECHYDFHVPTYNNYWANGYIHHNCGKSTLCEAVSVCRDYVIAKSTIRGFHSGYKEDGSQGEDNSLIPLITGRTLVTKDGDTLLTSPNLPQILSEARDLYDCTARTHYRNKMGRDYQGIRMTWILCGTNSLRQLDSSELGERFLDCVIMDHIDDDLEDEVLWRVANRTARNMSMESDGKPVSQYEPELAYAMQLTGGYASWLREIAQEQMSTIVMPDWAMRLCTRLGKFTAHMRARPSLRQEEVAEREFASRLVSQLVRTAKCLALVLNAPETNEVVMRRVRQIALDTSRGQTLAIVHHLYESGVGLPIRKLAMQLGRSEDKLRSMLRFLKHIGVAEPYEAKTNQKTISTQILWRLTGRMVGMYQDVVVNALGNGE
ncbi:Hint domain-containing protein [Candidatus Pacearchaeota archaeon]|jgi:hypothetical protein|nr:Hint domain-containing protein [Candidatus Pacearchaeota archaeon]